MDPVLYANSNRMHYELSKKLVEEIVASSNWSDAHLETVMDIGCGPGNTSTYWINYYFPNIERLIGIDFDAGMISLAKMGNKSGKSEFYVADITKKDSLKKWEGSVTRIISTYVLQKPQDQKQAFKNVFDLLKPSGEAVLCFVLSGPFFMAFEDLLKTPKWKSILGASKYFSFPESYIKNYDETHYKQMFEEIGFIVSLCETRSVVYSHRSDEECLNLLESFTDIGTVSNEVKEEYKKELFEQFLKHSPRDSEGRATHNFTELHAKLRKDNKQ